MKPDALPRFVERAAEGGLFLDFDGTLSEIVDLPSEARPLDGAIEILTELASRLRLVAIVSGRSAHQLLAWLGPDIEIWGLHGAERTVDGEVVLGTQAAPFEELIQKVHRQAEAELSATDLTGVILENKGVMVTFHYRTALDRPRAELVLDDLIGRLAEQHGLIRNSGKFAFELQPPVRFSKRAVVLDRSREEALEAVCFAGDDIVDLPGYDAVDELEKEGLAGLRIAVDSVESPGPLIERADVVVPNPQAFLVLLRQFL